MINIIASDVYALYYPVKCEKRVYFKSHDVKESEPDELDKLIQKLGLRHENNYLKTFKEVYDVSKLPRQDQVEATIKAIEKGTEVIYQGVLTTIIKIDGVEIELTGKPDFMIKDGDSYIIQDCKVARKLDKHPEISLQLQIYSLLFEKVTGKKPAGLEAYLGDGTKQAIFSNDGEVISLLSLIKHMELLKTEPYTPVGWSKCGKCPFNYLCWAKAMKNNDVATLPDVNQDTAIELRDIGIENIDQLLDENNKVALKGLKKFQKKQSADRIIMSAHARRENKSIWLYNPVLPENENYVAQYFECSLKQAREYINIMGQGWAKQIKNSFGGQL